MDKSKTATIKLPTFEEIKNFANVVSGFESPVNIYFSGDSKYYDAKSILAILALDGSKERAVEIVSDNDKEVELFLYAMKRFAP